MESRTIKLRKGTSEYKAKYYADLYAKTNNVRLEEIDGRFLIHLNEHEVEKCDQ